MRLLITALHLSLAVGTVMSASWLAAQAVANRVWEQTWYGVTSDATWALGTVAALGLAFGIVHALATLGWLVGSRRSGLVLLGLSALLALAGTPFVAVVLVLASLWIVLDLMVLAHRAGSPPPSSGAPPA